MKRMMTLILTAFVAGAIVACNSTSTATDDDSNFATTAQLAALQATVATLQTAVTALQAQAPASRPAVFITAPNAKTYATRSVTRAINTGAGIVRATQPCTGIGTLTGRPSSSDPLQSGVVAGISCTGYYFDISVAAAGDQAFIQQFGGAPGGNRSTMGFDGPGCTGNAYAMETGNFSGVSASSNGAVFTLNPQTGTMNGTDWTNPANYWYVVAGEAGATFTMASESQSGQTCLNVAPGPSFGWLAQQNNPVVTGVQSAPVPGPVLITD